MSIIASLSCVSAPIRKLLEGEETHFNSGVSFGASFGYQPRATGAQPRGGARDKEGSTKESYKEEKDEADVNSNNWRRRDGETGTDAGRRSVEIDAYCLFEQTMREYGLYCPLQTSSSTCSSFKLCMPNHFNLLIDNTLACENTLCGRKISDKRTKCTCHTSVSLVCVWRLLSLRQLLIFN